MQDRIGEQWGNYRLIQLLGRGGFAEVYLGQHLRLTGQRAALKILATRLGDADIDRFHNEAETIVSLVHPHIVRVLDFSLNEGVPFLVMDYAPGGSLRRRHPRGERVDLGRVITYVQQVAEGLQYAHDRKIIHRDIKPDNMLIGSRDEILLSDFGIATIAHGTNSQTAQLAMGTVHYMAPEQIQEHPRPASDQYALAVTVYEWLTGWTPFSGTFTEVATKHLITPPPPLRGSVPTLPWEVEQVILTALSKDPRARFGSVTAFATALREAGADARAKAVLVPPAPLPVDPEPAAFQTPPNPYPDPHLASGPPLVVASAQEEKAAQPVNTPHEGWERLQPGPIPAGPLTPDAAVGAAPPGERQVPQTGPAQGRTVSRRVVVAGLAALGVLVVGGGAVALLVTHGPQPQPSGTAATSTPARAPTPTPEPFAGKLLTTYAAHRGAVRTLDWSPDSKLVASGAADSTVRIWNAATGETALTYTRHPSELLSVAWSPDGKLIASGGRASAAQIWDASTGAQIFNYTGHTDDVHGIAWSLDSKLVASASDDRTVQVWDARTGTRLSTYRGHTAPVESVEWSPVDANLIVTACDDHTVQIVQAQTGTLVRNFPGHRDWVLSARWSPDGRLIASAGRDKTLRVWNAGTGSLLFMDTSHASFVEKVAWSPDGKLIASVGDDKTVQVLEVSTRKLVFNQKMDSFMYALAWSPNGTFIATGGADKAAQVWSAR